MKSLKIHEYLRVWSFWGSVASVNGMRFRIRIEIACPLRRRISHDLGFEMSDRLYCRQTLESYFCIVLG